MKRKFSAIGAGGLGKKEAFEACIKNHEGEYLYVNEPTYGKRGEDAKKRFLLGWGEKGGPDDTMMFEFVKYDDDTYGIRSIKHNEWLYAGDPKLNEHRRYVLSWNGAGSPKEHNGMRWQIEDLGGSKFAIKNVRHPEFMYCANPMLARQRRHTLTWSGDSHHARYSTSMHFEIERPPHATQIIMELVLLQSKEANGEMELDIEWTEGYEDFSSQHNDYVAAAQVEASANYGVLSAKAAAQCSVSSKVFSSCSTSASKKQRSIFKCPDGKPAFVYHAKTTVVMSDGARLTWGGELVMKDTEQKCHVVEDF